MMNVLGKVKNILHKVANVNGNINEKDTLFEDLGISSAQIIDVLLQIEKECGITIDLENLKPEHLHSVGTLTKYITELMDGNG